MLIERVCSVPPTDVTPGGKNKGKNNRKQPAKKSDGEKSMEEETTRAAVYRKGSSESNNIRR
jgi:hypothetical protein